MNDISYFHPPNPLNTAVLFLIFNRLDITKRVFKAIRQAKPPRLYIAADGARANKKGERKNVQAVRDYIIQNVDWDCDIKTLFRDQNLGCKYAVGGAITWFFENEEHGIILEDDCLPSQSFFWYCEELLLKYKDDKSIYLISADSRGPDSIGMKEDYGFCKYPMVWGWASWSRAWKDYDPELKDWPNHKDILPASISTNKPTIRFWKKVFQKMYDREVDTWDYQFCYLLLKNNGKCIVPKFNLVTNLGFGVDATHTSDAESKNANRRRYELNIPLNVTPNSETEKKINSYYDRNEFSRESSFTRIINKFTKFINRNNITK